MTVWIEGSKAVTEALALAVDGNDAEIRELTSVAKAYVGEHCPDIVDDCVQMTGGIGVTWEHDIQIYNRRAVLDRAVYGTPEEHKSMLYGLLGGRVSEWS
jgi:alkylation response protein AidB-like acyl-CoA dehydrogenase